MEHLYFQPFLLGGLCSMPLFNDTWGLPWPCWRNRLPSKCSFRSGINLEVLSCFLSFPVQLKLPFWVEVQLKNWFHRCCSDTALTIAQTMLQAYLINSHLRRLLLSYLCPAPGTQFMMKHLFISFDTLPFAHREPDPLRNSKQQSRYTSCLCRD